ncbi:alpha/beta fold hydrolase [Cupriavidus basilensis]|uniref:Alpha/beta fold hydrolase n=1 Tax=Cupriavidus basilensis TaxID=68895 RepID=A0ABT6ANW6_9BURK|nr:alpha/beta fold hydrolase [Cupriavidus basilensis]MDF3834293.1 alpha/beta fold hydrolase [Cupriavidus basilensis]
MKLSAAALRRIAVALQAAAALGCAAALHAWLGWPIAAGLLAGIGVALAAYGLSVAGAFAISLRGLGEPAGTRPPVPPVLQAIRPAPLTLAQALTCFLREYAAVFRMFNWLQPFCSQRRFAPARAPASHPPLLLVHGYGCNHAVWLDMQPALAAAGYHCEAIDLEPVFGDIDQYALEVRAAIARIAATTGQPPLLLCHSMGGLAARAALAGRGAAPPCRGIVTLGTPHHGCALARYGSGFNARQMRCGSAWLRALAAREKPRQRETLVSIFSWHDSIAGPAGTAWLDGAHHIALAGIGHVSLLRHPRVTQAVLGALAQLSAVAPTA